VVYDPCNPVPGTNIPTGLPGGNYHRAVHHVIGRIRHRVHHKYVHAGPPPAAAPNPYGCEKHAAAGPGYGHGSVPTTPFPAAAPYSKLAALGGGAVAFGGLGGLIGGLIPGVTPGKTTATKVALAGPGVNPTIPVTVTPAPTVTTPGIAPTPSTPVINPTTPVNPAVPVPEPSSIAIFLFAVLIALAARHFVTVRRPCKQAIPSA
jgi:hypothetical protein